MGGSVSQAWELSLGHDLVVHGFETHICRCADSLEPASYFGYPSLSLPAPSPLMLCSFLSKIKHLKKNLKKRGSSLKPCDPFYESWLFHLLRNFEGFKFDPLILSILIILLGNKHNYQRGRDKEVGEGGKMYHIC